jgi:hypothetical protein
VTFTFFDVLHAPTINAKQLKLRDLSGVLVPMLKLASERKEYYIHKIFNLSFIPEV